MSAYVVWIDSHESKIFKLTPHGIESKHLKTHGHKHHTEAHGKHSGGHHPESETLFRDTAKAIGDASELLIMGPGEAKTSFKSHLDKHHSSDITKKVVGVETADHPTDNQIVAAAKKFFKNYDLFH